MNNDFVDFNELSNDNSILNIQLECAKDFYERVDNGCKNIENKAQWVMTASLTTLSIIFASITLLIKESSRMNFTDVLLISFFAVLISFFIIMACNSSLKTFSLNTYYLIGKNDILHFTNNALKQLVSKYLNYAVRNTDIKREKRDLLIDSRKYFNYVLWTFLVYVIIFFVKLNISIFKPLILTFISFFNFKIQIYFIVLIAVAIFLIYILCKFIKGYRSNMQKLKNIQIKEQIRQEAYYNHLKYPSNTAEENWLLAEEKIK